MKKIERRHNFENNINFVKKARKYLYVYSEISLNALKIKITEENLNAFNSEDWKYFDKIYMQSI